MRKKIITIVSLIVLCTVQNICSAKDVNPVNTKLNVELYNLLAKNINWDSYNWMPSLRSPEIEFKVNSSGSLEYMYLKLLVARFSRNEKLCFDALNKTVPFPSQFRNQVYTWTCSLDTGFTKKEFKDFDKLKKNYVKEIKNKIESNRSKESQQLRDTFVDFKINKNGQAYDFKAKSYDYKDEAFEFCKKAIEVSSPFTEPPLEAFSKYFDKNQHYIEISVFCN